MSKILERKTIGNGYVCSCCRSEYETAKWIDEIECMSEEELIEFALENDPWGDDDNGCPIVRLYYERDGDVLYGFRYEYGRAGHHTLFTHPNGAVTKLAAR